MPKAVWRGVPKAVFARVRGCQDLGSAGFGSEVTADGWVRGVARARGSEVAYHYSRKTREANNFECRRISNQKHLYQLQCKAWKKRCPCTCQSYSEMEAQQLLQNNGKLYNFGKKEGFVLILRDALSEYPTISKKEPILERVLPVQARSHPARSKQTRPLARVLPTPARVVVPTNSSTRSALHTKPLWEPPLPMWDQEAPHVYLDVLGARPQTFTCVRAAIGSLHSLQQRLGNNSTVSAYVNPLQLTADLRETKFIVLNS
jgi:hypothetical protein